MNQLFKEQHPDENVSLGEFFYLTIDLSYWLRLFFIVGVIRLFSPGWVFPCHRICLNLHCDKCFIIFYVSYKTYRACFNNDINKCFGYPIKDTCSNCDEFIVKLQQRDSEILTNTIGEELLSLNKGRTELVTSHEVHKRKATIFYSMNIESKARSQASHTKL